MQQYLILGFIFVLIFNICFIPLICYFQIKENKSKVMIFCFYFTSNDNVSTLKFKKKTKYENTDKIMFLRNENQNEVRNINDTIKTNKNNN